MLLPSFAVGRVQVRRLVDARGTCVTPLHHSFLIAQRLPGPLAALLIQKTLLPVCDLLRACECARCRSCCCCWKHTGNEWGWTHHLLPIGMINQATLYYTICGMGEAASSETLTRK